ncbi:ribonuclease domain-containing protein [Streptomyces klenkii]|uniref:ribonuclease domain-containing protein n=1 Tax=Streptomyces TaxID=1883 RepID=UPI002B4B842B|nr:ribonuclease domain-containing protein [Streptomyces sp. NRRL B-1677]
MIAFRDPWRTAAGALLLPALGLFASAPSAPAPQAPVHPAPAALVHAVARQAGAQDPPWPVERFPSQVKNACGIWKGLDWPQAERATDYAAGPGLVIRGSNVYRNLSRALPAAGHYREYDVNPRPTGRHRDAERLVRDTTARTVWYSGDHYATFRQISAGCP